MTITLYGIPNCDTMKKARTWLDTHQVEHVFHDFKKAGVTAELINGWLTALPWELLLNRKGTTWRKLDEARRLQVQDGASALALMLENPSVIKRPVLDLGPDHAPALAPAIARFHVGFNGDQYQFLFQSSTPSRS
jgi:arsenate reductase